MNKKGFTLVELLMVVIIIGILVTLAVPNYYRSIERAKAGKAKAAMDAIRKAQMQYRAYNDTYIAIAAGADYETPLARYDLPASLNTGNDGDWSYATEAGTGTGGLADSIIITATRLNGPHDNTLLMDQDGAMANPDGIEEWGVTPDALP